MKRPILSRNKILEDQPHRRLLTIGISAALIPLLIFVGYIGTPDTIHTYGPFSMACVVALFAFLSYRYGLYRLGWGMVTIAGMTLIYLASVDAGLNASSGAPYYLFPLTAVTFYISGLEIGAAVGALALLCVVALGPAGEAVSAERLDIPPTHLKAAILITVLLLGLFEWVRRRLEREVESNARIIEAQSRMATIGETAAGVGHEINNPLAVAFAHLELLSTQTQDPTQFPEMNPLEQIERTKQALHRIKKIVRNLRTLSHPSHTDSIEEEFDPVELCEETADFLQELFKKNGIKIEIQSSRQAGELAVRGDAGKIQQVITNLLSNARDALEKASVKLISLSISTPTHQEVKIQVADAGTGIPKEVADRIFESSFTTKELGKGTGLGLSLSRKFVQQHGGTLKLLSSSTKGTIIEITLPLSSKNDLAVRT